MIGNNGILGELLTKITLSFIETRKSRQVVGVEKNKHLFSRYLSPNTTDCNLQGTAACLCGIDAKRPENANYLQRSICETLPWSYLLQDLLFFAIGG